METRVPKKVGSNKSCEISKYSSTISDSMNETCKATSDCSSIQGSTCVDERCVCKHGYTRDGAACWITGITDCFEFIFDTV